ncbi:MAG: hypothetical protein ACK53Y_26105, partial [bacterium]
MALLGTMRLQLQTPRQLKKRRSLKWLTAQLPTNPSPRSPSTPCLRRLPSRCRPSSRSRRRSHPTCLSLSW